MEVTAQESLERTCCACLISIGGSKRGIFNAHELSPRLAIVAIFFLGIHGYCIPASDDW
jgi:hypothetical protein